MTSEVDPNRQHMSRGVSSVNRVGNLVFVSGQVSLDDDRNLVGQGDIGAQTKQVFTKMEALLKTAGATMSDVAKITAYLVNADDYPGYTAVRGQSFRDGSTASATVIVKQLVDPEFLVEVEAIAVVR